MERAEEKNVRSCLELSIISRCVIGCQSDSTRPCGACCGKPRSSANEYHGSFHPLGRSRVEMRVWRVFRVMWATCCVQRVDGGDGPERCERAFECCELLLHIRHVVTRHRCASNPACSPSSAIGSDWHVCRHNWTCPGCDCVDSEKSAVTSLSERLQTRLQR